MFQGTSLLWMRHLSWVSSSTEILHFLSRVDHSPVVTFEALQVYFLLSLYFNLILQWVEARESYQNVAVIFLVSHAVLQRAGCIQHKFVVVLQLLTDHAASTEEDEALFFPCCVSWLETTIPCSDAPTLHVHRIFMNSAASSWY